MPDYDCSTTHRDQLRAALEAAQGTPGEAAAQAALDEWYANCRRGGGGSGGGGGGGHNDPD